MNYKYRVTATFEIVISCDDMLNWYAPGIGASCSMVVKDMLTDIPGVERAEITALDFVEKNIEYNSKKWRN